MEKTMLSPGDVVIIGFLGAVATKTRPAVVVSTTLYQTHCPDVIVGLLATNVRQATTPTDYRLRDWSKVQACLARALALEASQEA